MSVHKRKNGSWYYIFDAPGSSKADRHRVKKGGFRTRREASDAEATRRVEIQQQRDAARTDAPKTFGWLMSAFLDDRASKLAAKTVERYRELAAYVSPDLLALHVADVTAPMLEAEWTRLLASGGHKRGTKEARPLAPKTVRHIAGVISSAFSRGIYWRICTVNPVPLSDPPVPGKRKGMALTPQQQELLYAAATSPWCLGDFLRMEGATGARRGEVLALRWSDIEDGRVTIARSLSQTKGALEFKSTKTEGIRVVSLPQSMLNALDVHRARQSTFRQQFAEMYADGDLIFANPDGTPFRPDSISASVSTLFTRCGIARPRGTALHILRHSHGSQLLAAGVDLATVSERLGHSSVRVTADVYSHSLRGRDDQAAKAWEQFQRVEMDESTKPN